VFAWRLCQQRLCNSRHPRCLRSMPSCVRPQSGRLLPATPTNTQPHTHTHKHTHTHPGRSSLRQLSSCCCGAPCAVGSRCSATVPSSSLTGWQLRPRQQVGCRQPG
jgi:hypothetical protein